MTTKTLTRQGFFYLVTAQIDTSPKQELKYEWRNAIKWTIILIRQTAADTNRGQKDIVETLICASSLTLDDNESKEARYTNHQQFWVVWKWHTYRCIYCKRV